MKEITIFNDYNPDFSYNSDLIEKLVLDILSEKNFLSINLSIIFTKKTFLSDMKKKYFNVKQFTDVIAFNFNEKGNILEGEIYISIDDVKENSKIFSQSFNNELKRIIIHGALHLLGYDDKSKDEIKKMRKLEDKYLLQNKAIIAN